MSHYKAGLIGAIIATIRLIHAERPTQAIACEMLGISRATFYRHLDAARNELGMVIEQSEWRYQIHDYGILNAQKLKKD